MATEETRNPTELYSAALDNTLRIVAGVGNGAWNNATPCTEWSVRDVVNHLASENMWLPPLLEGRTIEEVGSQFDGDLLGDDPINVYSQSVETARAAALAPGALEAICHLSFGDHPGSLYLSQMFLDTLVHGWDVAVGSSQDATLPEDLVAACYPIAQMVRHEAGGSGIIGDNLEDPSADMEARLLGLLGRTRP